MNFRRKNAGRRCTNAANEGVFRLNASRRDKPAPAGASLLAMHCGVSEVDRRRQLQGARIARRDRAIGRYARPVFPVEDVLHGRAEGGGLSHSAQTQACASGTPTGSLPRLLAVASSAISRSGDWAFCFERRNVDHDGHSFFSGSPGSAEKLYPPQDH